MGPLTWAARSGAVATLRGIAEAGANVRAATGNGFTALDVALQRPADDPNRSAVVEWLEAREAEQRSE